MQKLNSQGINTLVLGVPSPFSLESAATLQAIANAGVGLPVSVPSLDSTGSSLCFSCLGRAGWRAEWGAVARECTVPGKQTLGNYSQIGGDAPLYRADTSDPVALT